MGDSGHKGEALAECMRSALAYTVSRIEYTSPCFALAKEVRTTPNGTYYYQPRRVVSGLIFYSAPLNLTNDALTQENNWDDRRVIVRFPGTNERVYLAALLQCSGWDNMVFLPS